MDSIKINENQILILKTEMLLKPSDREKVRKEVIRQIAEGAVIIPNGFSYEIIEADENGWIPCEKRKPEHLQTVIYNAAAEVDAGWYDADKDWCVNENYFPNAFLFDAWQPLPAPYKKG